MIYEKQRLVMASVTGPISKTATPHLRLSMVQGDSSFRTEQDLQGPERTAIRAIPAEEWLVAIKDDRLGPKSVIRVTVVGRSGEEYFSAQEVVSFFLPKDGDLIHLWTGLGAHFETRSDTCILETTARFLLRPNGQLDRKLKTKKKVRDPGETEPDVLKAQEKDCIVPRVRRELFDLLYNLLK
jgi:hypothetical protein